MPTYRNIENALEFPQIPEPERSVMTACDHMVLIPSHRDTRESISMGDNPFNLHIYTSLNLTAFQIEES